MKPIINKNIILRIIANDMRNHKLVSGLESLNLSDASKYYCADSSVVVASLMGIPEDKISNAWLDMYMKFIFSVTNMEVKPESDYYFPVAEKCYDELVRLSC